MIPLYSQEEFNKSKSRNKLPLKCGMCDGVFYKEKNQIQATISAISSMLQSEHIKNNKKRCTFCSKKCKNLYNIKKKNIECKNCGKIFNRVPNKIKKFNNHFCSRSCSATYQNTHKTKNIKRSKLEIWLEKQLTQTYPNLEIHFNRKDAINSELDIYIPSFKLAFELNGIFHYEPIYGEEQLKKIKNNDSRKFQACIENKIELCIIDASSMDYFKENKSKIYLDIITNIICKYL